MIMAAVASRPKRPPQFILANKEKPIPLREVGRYLPGEPGYDAVYKWHLLGRKIDGSRERVHLETIDLPAGLCTSIEAYWRFVERLNGG